MFIRNFMLLLKGFIFSLAATAFELDPSDRLFLQLSSIDFQDDIDSLVAG